jgi:hypothetical protein
MFDFKLYACSHLFGFAHICLDSLTFVWISVDSLAFERIFVVHDQYYYLANSIANVDVA